MTFRLSRHLLDPLAKEPTVGMPRVCWPLCAWIIRATIRGAGPVDFRCRHWDPGGMPMAFVRCYTGTDGQSHFEDMDLLPA